MEFYQIPADWTAEFRVSTWLRHMSVKHTCGQEKLFQAKAGESFSLADVTDWAYYHYAECSAKEK